MTDTSDMVERLTTIIAAEIRDSVSADIYFDLCGVERAAEDAARRVILALREPSDRMLYAGSWAVGPGGDPAKKAELSKAFTAMIDAALSPGSEG